MSSKRPKRPNKAYLQRALLAGSLGWALLFGCGDAFSGARDADGGALFPDAMAPAQDAADTSASDGGEDVGQERGDASSAGSEPDAAAEEPSGRHCEDALPLTGASGSAELVYDAEETSAFEGSCGGEGPERAFAFTLAERSLYSFDLTGESVDGVLFLRSDCRDAASEIGCDDGLDADHLSGELEAGTYYLFADAYAAVAQGASTLTWKIERHPCLDVQCGEGANCTLSEERAAQCICESDFIYDGSRCVANPCARDPCSAEPFQECTYAVEALPEHACVPRAWTVLVYMSADNDLFGGAQANLEEMRQASLRASSQSTLTLIALIDGPSQGDTQLLRIRRGKSELLDPFETFLAGRSELDMADAMTLRDFGVWAIEAYPAERYGLILWDHGSGWRSLRWMSEASTSAAKGDDLLAEDERMRLTMSWEVAARNVSSFVDARQNMVMASDACAGQGSLKACGLWAPEHRQASHALLRAEQDAFSSMEVGATAGDDRPARIDLGVQVRPRGFSNDFTDNPEDRTAEISISSGEYAWALDAMLKASGQKFDLIAFDACQMGLYEVAHASAPYADYLVASEDRIPAQGFPYLEFLTYLYEDDTRQVRDWARVLIDAYVASSSAHYTLSAVDLSTQPELDLALDVLADALSDDIEDRSRLLAIAELREQTLGFYAKAHRDLGDFARRLSGSAAVSAKVGAAASALYQQLGRSVLHTAAQVSHASATGLAIYFPAMGTGVDDAYLAESALWNQATRWSNFLTSFARTDSDAPTSD